MVNLIKEVIEFYLIFVGDLNDDLILMNELESIRYIQSNKINNSSLGEKYSLINFSKKKRLMFLLF
jgi:hypothetical protein